MNMTIEDFKHAKYIRESIDHFNVKKLQTQQMAKRENDEEFNLCRALALDGIRYMIKKLEEEFKAL